MKKLISLLMIVLVILSTGLTVFAADGQVTYDGDAGEFIFAPGSDYSPTDLFPNFKDVMPGDTLEQRIVVRNDVSRQVKVRIFMRALGAWEGSEEFLSQLQLKVVETEDMLLFDAPADQTATLTDWVYLGTLYSGGECELIVTLDVPVTLDNEFKNYVGYLDWEFAVEELPIDPDDPLPPQTGDTTQPWLWWILLVISAAVALLAYRRRAAHE